jgi:hypothetical protein
MDAEDDKVENYTCAMPRYYAIPLILINKKLAYFEAQCRPDGTPLPPPSNCSSIKLRELREYSYLWRLRCLFLQAIFEMNHERRLNERWQFDGIHGFLHRMYRRFGHDLGQRLEYWREEQKEGRVAYSMPDIAEMNWEAYLLEDMTTSTRINAFLWNRVSQGYSLVVEVKPPFEGWRAWRMGHRDHIAVLYRTPASSPVCEPPSELGEAAAAAVAEKKHGRDVEVRRVVVAPAAASSSSGHATARRGGVRVGVNEEEENTGYEDVLTATLTGPSHSQEWVLPSPTPSPGASQGTSSSSPEYFRPWDLRFMAPENMELAVVQCTFSRIKAVRDYKTTLNVFYAS